MILRKSTKEYGERLIAKAESYLGYTARPGRNSIFGETVGYNNAIWDGAFIDVIAREVGLPLPAHVYTASALSYYIRTRTLHVKPKRGDIVFFETSTDGIFNHPHVGIVTDASRYLADGVLQTIEANVGSGQPKSATDLADGVYRRTRNQFEILGFGRPPFRKLASRKVEINPTVPKIVPAQARPGIRHANVAIIQMALAEVTGVRRLPKGHFDGKTRSAYARFQRSIGVVDANGVPDVHSLQRLASETGLFTASE